MFDTSITNPHEELGRRLKQCRSQKGFSFKDVSQAVGLSVKRIEELEAGTADSGSELSQALLQDVYRLQCFYNISSYELLRGLLGTERTPLFFLRDKSNNDFEEKYSYISECIQNHRKLHGVRDRIVGLKSKRRIGKVKDELTGVLRRRAEKVLRNHSMQVCPVNIYEIAASLGCHIVFETFPSKLFDLRGFCHSESRFKIIGVNKIHSSELQRFTVAHELHHLLYDIDTEPYLCGLFNESEMIERNAERFASEVLIPEESLRRLFDNKKNAKYITISLIAEHFAVSYQAASIRLEKFGVIKSASSCSTQSYRKKDKKKTAFLKSEKLDYLRAIFGLYTGIDCLQLESLETHDRCGKPIYDSEHSTCWHCGLKLQNQNRSVVFDNSHTQNKLNLKQTKEPSFEVVHHMKSSMQLSLNLRIS
jgi:Zn-dependent peptidase ImmA (M78 family)/transcriptional regulator with XRE-family HTH domain